MLVIQILILSILLLAVPMLVGSLFTDSEKTNNGLIRYWISGQILLWAVFLLISVPLILKQKNFSLVQDLYNGSIFVFVLAAVLVNVVRLKRKKVARLEATPRKVWTKGQVFLWAVFGILLLLQLVLSVVLAYEEGDDAFYVAISTATAASDRMYQTLAYTGLATELDARHGLAPFPVWIAYLARMSGMIPVTVAQIAVPVVIILQTYAIYHLIAVQLFAENQKNVPLFLVLVEIMFLFGGYSVYSAENFLLVRATQGKAVIANVILPFLFYLMFLLAEKMQKKEGFGRWNWILLGATMLAGCLCSTLGILLTGMLIGVVGVCMAVVYRKWTVLLPLAFSCVIPGLLAVLYFTISSV